MFKLAIEDVEEFLQHVFRLIFPLYRVYLRLYRVYLRLYRVNNISIFLSIANFVQILPNLYKNSQFIENSTCSVLYFST